MGSLVDPDVDAGALPPVRDGGRCDAGTAWSRAEVLGGEKVCECSPDLDSKFTADKNELEGVQMSRARQGRWVCAALQMRECASDMFLEESERTGWFDI